ncbi:MAG: hypothetical protein ICV72_09570 [Aldersonia sp.]|nr:hypothetical protein [Aldersonia sp.]
MRSATGPILIILSLATAVVLVLVLLQTIGLRNDLNTARDQVAALEGKVEGMERGVPLSELSMRMGELENNLRDWVVAFAGDVPPGGDPSSPAGGDEDGTDGGTDEVLDRLDEVLAAVEALDARVDEICEGVPVC